MQKVSKTFMIKFSKSDNIPNEISDEPEEVKSFYQEIRYLDPEDKNSNKKIIIAISNLANFCGMDKALYYANKFIKKYNFF